MAEAAFRIRAAGKDYELARLTLGDMALLRRDYGLRSLSDLDPSDPQQLIGLMLLAEAHRVPDRPVADIKAELEAIDISTFEVQPAPVEPDPTPEAAAPADPASEAALPAPAG